MKILKALATALFVVAISATGSESTNRLYIMDPFDGIYRSELDGTNLTLIVPEPGDCITASMDVDVHNGKIYVALNCAIYDWYSIERASVDGSDRQEFLFRDNGNFISVAVHGAQGSLYWLQYQYGETTKLEKSPLHNATPELLIADVGNVGGLVLDPIAGQLYWVMTDRIQRADLLGQEIEDLVTGLSWPSRPALDPYDGKVYWTELVGSKIQRANLFDGSNTEDVVTGLNQPGGLALDLDAGKLYWTELSKVRRANLDGSSIEDVIVGGISPALVRVANDNPTAVGNSEPALFHVEVRTERGSEIGFFLQLPQDGRVVLDLYAVTGRRVRRVLDRHLPAGVHLVPWQGTDSQGRQASSGVYFYRVTAGNRESDSGRFIRIR